MNKYLLGSILWALLILILTLTPGKHIPQIGVFSYDKLGHSLIFGILSFLIPFGLRPLKNFTVKKAILTSFIFTLIYGSTLEIIQDFIPGRAMDYVDALANALGAIGGVLLFYVVNKMRS